MSWNKVLMLGCLALLFSSTVFAEKVNCPSVLKDGNKIHRINVVDVFEGPPEERGSLMPDSDDSAVWTLSDSQAAVKARNTSMYLVCQFKGTNKTVTLKIPASAKKCSAWIEGSAEHTHIVCE